MLGNSFLWIHQFCQFCQVTEIHEKLFSSIFMNICEKDIVRSPSIPHFKGLDMRNLQYEIRVCQKIHNKVTLTISSYFDFGQFCQFPDTHVQLFSNIFINMFLDRIIIRETSISHLKGLGITNLQYNIKKCIRCYVEFIF